MINIVSRVPALFTIFGNLEIAMQTQTQFDLGSFQGCLSVHLVTVTELELNPPSPVACVYCSVCVRASRTLTPSYASAVLPT
jgi:hypothetical protein